MELIKINANFLTPFLEKIKNLNSDHPEVEYFYAFLIKLQCVLDVYFRILPEISNNVPSYMQSVMDNFSQYQPNNKQYSDVTALKREKFVNFSSINGNSEKFPIDCEIRKQLDIIKKELIYEIENMITYTRKSPLLGIVLYVLFFEYYPVSQDRIIELTGYGRSSISEALTQLIDIKLVQKMKKTSDRHHYYYAKDDWDSLLKARISSLKIFLLTGNKIVEKYGEFLGKINANVEDAIKFHNFLGQLKIAFNEYGKFVDGFITKFNELII